MRSTISQRLLPLLAALALITTTGIRAQGGAASRFPYYKYDSTFVIGGYSVSRTWLLDSVREQLRFNTIGGYGAPTILDAATIDTAIHRYGDSFPKIQRTLIDYNYAAPRKLRFMYTPKLTGAMLVL